MKILRWLAFLPCAAVLVAIAQLLTGRIVEHSPWWIGLPLVFFFGVMVACAGIVPVKMTSNPKIAAAILLTLFVLLECLALTSAFVGLSTKALIGRMLVDIQIVIGAIAGAMHEVEKSEKSGSRARV